MKLVDVRCLSCGHIQEDFLPAYGDPEWEVCEACGSSSMEEVRGEIVPSSSSKAPNSGAGPWG